MNQKVNERLKKSCQGAIAAFQKLNDEKYADMQSKLEFVIGSYDFDGNPVGLNEYAKKSLQTLKKIKEKQPRSVTKKVIDDLEKSTKDFSQNGN